MSSFWRSGPAGEGARHTIPGIDLVAATGQGYTHLDGAPYPPEPRKT